MPKSKLHPFPAQKEAIYNANDAKLCNELGTCLKTARMNLHMQQRNVVDRLAQYGITISAGALSKWENGDAMPNPYQFFALCYVYELDDVLKFFTGKSGRKLNKIGRKKVQEYEQDLLATGLYDWEDSDVPHEDCTHNHQNDALQYIQMPVSVLKTSAGYGNFLDEDSFEEVLVPEDSVPKGATFGVYVSGDSMLPKYKDGDLVWVQPCEQLRPHDIGIFICDGDGFIKMYDEIVPSSETSEDYTDSNGAMYMQPVLVSLNRHYPPKVIDPTSDFRIVGRVLN